MSVLPNAPLSIFISWLKKFSKNSRGGYRLFATEILSLLFHSKDFLAKDLKQGSNSASTQKELFEMLLARTLDKSAK